MKMSHLNFQMNSITRRIAMLSWLTTVITLLIFVLVIVPEQKRTYLESLESKARGISASLQDVIAGAVVTEDYSSVVEHCKQVLQGDHSIEFLVITKNDGFSLVHMSVEANRSGDNLKPSLEAQWRIETLDHEWHPTKREPYSTIGVISLFDQRTFRFSKPFDYSGIEWGWIHVGLSIESYDRSVRDVYRRTGLLAIGCLFFSLGTSVIYARRLIRPLLELKNVVSRVSTGDLSARASISSGDEIQDLAQSFNAMTEALLRRDRTLKETNETLEQRVTHRTEELQKLVAAREQSLNALAEAQRQLIDLSRKAGMADIATGVLHNVGNVLNSVNVSANLLRNGLSPLHTHLALLTKTTTLLREQPDLAGFLADDPRGRHIPRLLIELSSELSRHHQELLREVTHLSGNIDHIKQIVAVQQDYAKSGGLLQTVDPSELFAEALTITQASRQTHAITIEKAYPETSPGLIFTDRHQAIQILVNFLTNAIQAVKPLPESQRRIRLALQHRNERWQFTVEEKGIGIPAENLQRIFQHGFTTRKDGHGFGLHSGAIAARSLGGQIMVHSDGPNTGSCFTLELPESPPDSQPEPA